MRIRLAIVVALVVVGAAVTPLAATAATGTHPVRVNVLLDKPPSESDVAGLARHGAVLDVIPELRTVVLQTDTAKLEAVLRRDHVVRTTRDGRAAPMTRLSNTVPPIDPVGPHDLASGRNTWNMDAINVTDLGGSRVVAYDGSGTYVAMLDSGLTPAWRSYFPAQVMATGLARDFTDDRLKKGGPGGSRSWEHDLFGHGTSVTSPITGYMVDNPLYGPGVQGPVEGAAPGSRIIPVRVVDDVGDVYVSWLARGLVYVGSLKERELGRHPVVAQIDIVFYEDDPLLRAAVDFALARGVILVAAVGNSGIPERRYPAAYPEVIAVGATGLAGAWQPGPDGISGNWWRADDIADPTDPEQFYVTAFSTRAAPGQDLDVVAPGFDILAPTQWDGLYPDHRFVWGTSMSSPHVAGVVALMTQKNPALTPAQAEAAIEAGAVALGPGCRDVPYWPYLDPPPPVSFCWESNATGSGLLDAAGALAATPLP